MLLDDRKKRILQAIVNEYIETAEPVGSRTIAKKNELGLSSATIRNEMADLEEMGYISQPYTSAGRIPSDSGYRFYVDKLMDIRELTEEESCTIRAALETHISEMSDLIKIASEVMSKFTHYTSMGVTPKMKSNIIKTIQVIPVDFDKVLLILVTDTGIVKNNMAIVKEYLTDDVIGKIANMLNKKYCGLSTEKIIALTENNMGIISGISRDTLSRVHDAVMDCIRKVQNLEIYLEGATNILNYPEFKDVIKAQDFLNALEEKDILQKLLSYSEKNGNIKIRIGSENEIEKIRDCTLITAAYSMGEIAIGSIGVIGPTRMEYPKVISSMRYIRKKINEEIKKMIGELYD